ncbi:MAG: hypothetical protein Q8R37_00850 [Nanoarchaeota archaeon]|nr:hypothetical protein [Nanoarchaeota archaeon]
MKRKLITTVMVLTVVIVFAYGLYSFSGNHLTGRGSQPWGECLDADKNIEKGVPNGYCYDAESYKVDRCIDSAVLLDWYCHRGWCENKKVNCKDAGSLCQFGECVGS